MRSTSAKEVISGRIGTGMDIRNRNHCHSTVIIYFYLSRTDVKSNKVPCKIARGNSKTKIRNGAIRSHRNPLHLCAPKTWCDVIAISATSYLKAELMAVVLQWHRSPAAKAKGKQWNPDVRLLTSSAHVSSSLCRRRRHEQLERCQRHQEQIRALAREPSQTHRGNTQSSVLIAFCVVVSFAVVQLPYMFIWRHFWA